MPSLFQENITKNNGLTDTSISLVSEDSFESAEKAATIQQYD